MRLEKIVCKVQYHSREKGKLLESIGEIAKWQVRQFSGGANHFIVLENGDKEIPIYKGDIIELSFFKKFASLSVEKTTFNLCKSIKML
jgi:hypothetical protein